MLLRNTEPESRGASTSLVVIVHAFRRSSADMGDVRQAVAGARPDADLLVPDYPARVLSGADPVRIAEELVEVISKAVKDRKERGAEYHDIVLIGHSLGALFVRKAYVFARGQNQDHTGPLAPAPRSWAALVSRIILLAGVNRGWEPRHRGQAVSRWRWVGYALAAWLFRWTGLGGLVNGTRQGTPFVANLRIQWINLVRGSAPPPTTVQLLGDTDDVVAASDNIDLQAGSQFVYLQLRDTGHVNAIDFSGPVGQQRRAVFLQALMTSPGQLVSSVVLPNMIDSDVKRVVFVMHGIRDRGHQWTGALAQAVRAQAVVLGQRVEVVTSSYGYFPMIAFLLQPERQKNVRWFMDEYTEALARYPSAKLSFIGHSNGTYLLAAALKRYRACWFDRVVFAGSVVNDEFDWDAEVLAGRVQAVQNLVATGDLVVAVFPAVFYQLRGAEADLGGAGHDGFATNEGQRYQVCYIRGGHGAGKVPENFPAMARFALGDDTALPPAGLREGRQKWWVVWAGKFRLVIWFLILALAVGLVLLPVFLGATGWPAALECGGILLAVWTVLRWV
ncbi:MAG: hypothetical protein J0I06_03455 [Planctomycetes bacterium]|nr:hypothetical protein [Planctomycetota bacterium]